MQHLSNPLQQGCGTHGLRKQIESGSLLGGQGAHFSSSNTSTSAINAESKPGVKKRKKSNTETESGTTRQAPAEKTEQVEEKREGMERKIKRRKIGGGDSGSDTESLETASSPDADSEDDMPLAKLRKIRFNPPAEGAWPGPYTLYQPLYH